MPSKYGRQPAADLIKDSGLKYREVAATIGVPETPLVQSVLGYTRPRPDAITGLSRLFKVSAGDLFTEEVLAFPHNPRMNPWKSVSA